MPQQTPLRIIIIGAGLGGCAAAFCLARTGHHVKVFEQRPSLSDKGSGIMIQPAASRVLQDWGLGPQFDEISDIVSTTYFRDLKSGQILTKNVAVEVTDAPIWGTDRQVAQKLLYNCATAAGAEIEFGVSVHTVSDSTHDATVTLRGGETYAADLILAADGISSHLRAVILSDLQMPLDPTMSNITFYGIRLPLKEIQSDPETRLLAENGDFQGFAGNDLLVSCRSSSKLDTFAAHFGIVSEQTDMTKLWDEDGDIELVREAFADAHPALRATLAKSSPCYRWKLAEMPNLPLWASKNGHITLLGDSAHGMMPMAAQGFSQILEDIGALEALITHHRPLGIPELLNIWQSIRIPRVERIKGFTAWNVQVFLGRELKPPSSVSSASRPTGSRQLKSLKSVKPDASAVFQSGAFLKWVQDYDAAAEALKMVQAAKARI